MHNITADLSTKADNEFTLEDKREKIPTSFDIESMSNSLRYVKQRKKSVGLKGSIGSIVKLKNSGQLDDAQFEQLIVLFFSQYVEHQIASRLDKTLNKKLGRIMHLYR